jgi:septum formation protein
MGKMFSPFYDYKKEWKWVLGHFKPKDILPEINAQQVILAADTIVLLNNKIYGKPDDVEDAVRILKELSGQTHEVITGVCLMSKSKHLSFSDVTKVHFKDLDEEMIRRYIADCHPLDKAGAYAIQEWIVMIGISSIEGDYYNIVGLPVNKVYEALLSF